MLFALDQPSLMSSDQEAPIGLFFSIFPDPHTAGRIAQIAREFCCEYKLKGRPLLPARFHCSLYGFGDPGIASQTVIAKAREAASIVAAAPFLVSFNCVMSFSNSSAHRPLVLVGEDVWSDWCGFKRRSVRRCARSGSDRENIPLSRRT
jgi:2'-5' RNA ligase